MYQIVPFVLAVIGIVFIYSTSKHQRLSGSRRPKIFGFLGLGLLLFSLIGWLNMLTIAAAIFTWFVTVITLLACIPLLTLFKLGIKTNV